MVLNDIVTTNVTFIYTFTSCNILLIYCRLQHTCSEFVFMHWRSSTLLEVKKSCMCVDVFTD